MKAIAPQVAVSNRPNYPCFNRSYQRGKQLRILKTTTVAVILVAGAISSAQAAMPKSSIVNLEVSANTKNMPMSASGTMTSAMSGSAFAKFAINTKANTLCYSISAKGLKNITEAHVQVTSTEKDVLIFNPKKINSSNPSCLKVSSKSLADLTNYPSKYSFMVHTKAYPDGAVMGDLKRSR